MCLHSILPLLVMALILLCLNCPLFVGIHSTWVQSGIEGKQRMFGWMNGWMVSAPTLPLGQASMTSPITLIFKKAQICLQHEVYLFSMNSLPLGLLWFPPVCELWLILVTGTEYRKHVVFKECLVDTRGDNPTIIRPLLPVNGMFRELLRAQGPTGQTSSGWCY